MTEEELTNPEVDVPEGETFQLPVEWVIPEETTGSYATHIVVQHSDKEFILNFFEIRMPIFSNLSKEQKLEKLNEMESIKANCVSRIVVSPDRMENFVEVLKRNLEKYRQTIEGEENDDDQ